MIIELSNMISALPTLTAEEKLELLEALWEDVSANPDTIPIHEGQLEEMRRRQKKYADNPDAGMTWEEVKSKARADNAS